MVTVAERLKVAIVIRASRALGKDVVDVRAALAALDTEGMLGQVGITDVPPPGVIALLGRAGARRIDPLLSRLLMRLTQAVANHGELGTAGV